MNTLTLNDEQFRRLRRLFSALRLGVEVMRKTKQSPWLLEVSNEDAAEIGAFHAFLEHQEIEQRTVETLQKRFESSTSLETSGLCRSFAFHSPPIAILDRPTKDIRTVSLDTTINLSSTGTAPDPNVCPLSLQAKKRPRESIAEEDDEQTLNNPAKSTRHVPHSSTRTPTTEIGDEELEMFKNWMKEKGMYYERIRRYSRFVEKYWHRSAIMNDADAKAGAKSALLTFDEFRKDRDTNDNLWNSYVEGRDVEKSTPEIQMQKSDILPAPQRATLDDLLRVAVVQSRR